MKDLIFPPQTIKMVEYANNTKGSTGVVLRNNDEPVMWMTPKGFIGIELHQKSKDFLKTCFSKYKDAECGYVIECKAGVIIHLYPESDTYDKDGEALGYADSLLCTAKIYDFAEKKVYTKHNVDGIMSCAGNVRVFKDGSTVFYVHQNCEVTTGQCLRVTLL